MPLACAEWHLSICLFNYLQERRRYVLARQLVNTRPTKTTNYAGSRVLSNDSSWRLPPDPIDGALYAFVRVRLQEDLRRYGISMGCCPVYGNVSDIPDEPTPASTDAACLRKPAVAATQALARPVHHRLTPSAWRFEEARSNTTRPRRLPIDEARLLGDERRRSRSTSSGSVLDSLWTRPQMYALLPIAVVLFTLFGLDHIEACVGRVGTRVLALCSRLEVAP